MLFTNKRGCVVNRQSLHRSFRYALRTAELPLTVTFHQLRHTYRHLWPSSEDQRRLVLSRAFENADFSRTAEDRHSL